MDNASYQKFCKKKQDYDLSTLGLGLGGETGEVLDIIKKSIRDKKPIDREHIKEELGDVAWYLFNLCTALNFTFDEVIEANVSKLTKRYNIIEGEN